MFAGVARGMEEPPFVYLEVPALGRGRGHALLPDGLGGRPPAPVLENLQGKEMMHVCV